MKIAHKILMMIMLLLGLVSAAAWSGLRQMESIRGHYSAMVNDDVVLLHSVAEIHQLQLQKNILLQQLVGIAEELGFEKIAYARLSYLQDQLEGIRLAYQDYVKASKDETEKLKDLSAKAKDYKNVDHVYDARRDLILDGLRRLEKAREEYDSGVVRLLDSIKAGGFQLSLEDLEGLQNDERILTKDLARLQKSAQGSLASSLEQAKVWEHIAKQRLLIFLAVVFAVAFLLAVWIVASIVRPVSKLSQATTAIAKGDFKVQVDVNAKDEIAQLAKAFNEMSTKLQEYKDRIEKQNQDLKRSNEEIDKFIRVMGHDILNPLTMMIAYCAYIEQHAGPSLDVKNAESLNGIRKAATRMHSMVKELLEFAKSQRVEKL